MDPRVKPEDDKFLNIDDNFLRIIVIRWGEMRSDGFDKPERSVRFGT